MEWSIYIGIWGQMYSKELPSVDKLGVNKLKFVNIYLQINRSFVASLPCKIKIYA